MTDTEDRRKAREAIKAADRARNFPINTCPASRLTLLIGEALVEIGRYAMIEDDPVHVGVSLLATVEALYKARTEIDTLRERLGMPTRVEEARAAYERESDND